MGLIHTGGSRIGRSFLRSWNWTWPFARLGVAADALNLSTPGRAYEFGRDSVRAIRLVGPRGIAIEHAVPEVPPCVVFWSFNRDTVIAALQSEGYPILKGE
jgi:hypothetical protein